MKHALGGLKQSIVGLNRREQIYMLCSLLTALLLVVGLGLMTNTQSGSQQASYDQGLTVDGSSEAIDPVTGKPATKLNGVTRPGTAKQGSTPTPATGLPKPSKGAISPETKWSQPEGAPVLEAKKNIYLDGTVTPEHYAGTELGGGYTDEWLAYSPVMTTGGSDTWILEYDCSVPAESTVQCPDVILQSSGDGKNWNDAITGLPREGTSSTYKVDKPYYRLKLVSGSCLDNQCFDRPDWAGGYEFKLSTYYY